MAPRLSVSQITTLHSSFAEDLRDYVAAGLAGIGVWEMKLGEDGDAEALERFSASGLESAAAVPTLPSVLPLPLLGGPEDPAERVEAFCRSLERLAPFRPSSVVCLTGTGLGRDADEARAALTDGLATIADEAERLGLRIGIEPYQRIGGEQWTIVNSIAETVELIRDAGDPPALGIQFDFWHLWNSPTLYDDIEREIDRFVGVHVCDYREPTRGWADRSLPGEGIATSRGSCARSTPQAGTGSTTSRSSPTTARSAPSTRTRSGRRRPRRRSTARRRRSSFAGPVPRPSRRGGRQ